ncbi:MAG TPA: ABC transporter permease subunit [Patescibacteria group bacterium]|jgi:NitT/TauT family transport system permease protein|nr:ABC transporter permease subunit [Patescibacteria group bacterium]
MRRYLKIYHHPAHLLITIGIILLPLIFVAFVLPFSVHQKELFAQDLLASTLRLFIAYVISIFLALFFALFLTHGKLGDFFLPFFDVMQSFPTFAMLPLVVHYFGAGSVTVIIFLVVTVIWPILFAIISAQKLVKEEWDEAATIFGAKGWKRLLYYSLPLSYPGLITGSIVGLGEGWEAVVGAEIIVGLDKSGLGNFFSANSESSRMVLFGVLALLVCIFVLNKLIWLPLLEKSHKLLTD